ncbi:MAG: hypothetical protein HRT58_08150 [Crocinitomicaceae bacterium]|nr:hypothetical protein [Flavobacteriales bacterium]NQZ35620.1 hypothetical protein [Crocinitomicaceae bacterium]
METTSNKEFSIGGDANISGGTISFGDEFHNNYIEAESLRSEIAFKEIQSTESLDNDIPPKIDSKVLTALFSKRVIIFRNDGSIDMFDYQNEVSKHIQSKGSQKLFELFTNQNETSILSKLISREKGGIYFLNNIDALHIDFNLPELLAIANQKEMYFIVSTSSSKTRWELTGGQLSDCWIDIDPLQLYDIETIHTKLTERVSRLPFILKSGHVDKKTLLSTTFSLKHVADKIIRPLQLNLFIRRYEKFNALPTDSELESILDEIGGHSDEIIQRWFGKLDHSQKLITIAFTLFDGVYTSQFFEAIDRFFPANEDSIWKISAPELAALDYKDLSFLEPFIHEEVVQGNERLMSSRSDFRRVVFKTIWKTYRRHLMSVFPVLIGILSESYKGKTTNWELFGTTERRSNLRVSFVESISDLGIVQIDTAESILLDLAANGHFHLRGLVASSLAKWRAQDGDDKLFAVLKRWQENKSILAIVHEKLSRRITSVERSRAPKEEPIELIKSTVAITLSKAAEYDKKNHLNEHLIHLYIELAKDTSELVQHTVNKSLPDFIHKHVFQLKTVLFDELMQIQFYQESIATGLFNATVENVIEMKEIILDWLKACLETNSEENRRNKGTYRDNVLLTILTLIRRVINENNVIELFTKEELFSIGMKLFTQEGRPIVRDSVLELLAALTAQDPTLALTQITSIHRQFKGQDRRKFVRFITLQYIEQRSRQIGGDIQYEYKPDEFISSWLDKLQRPLTDIETNLIQWMNGENVTAKRVATLVFLDIAGLVEESESQYIILEKQRRIASAQEKVTREHKKKMTIPPVNTVVGLGFWLRVRIVFMLLFEPKANKLALKDIIHLLFNNKGHSLAHIRLMNQKWKHHDPSGLAGKLGTWLDRLL